ncbi:MAG: hypothetical protein H7067_15325 [Burkholderiales bacterium]|nr:hypothetical protein [Opitutaceae bacterium]
MIRSVEVTGDALATVQRARLILRAEMINPVVGRAAANVTVAHLRGLNATRANHLGGKRTNYFAGAARGTSYSIQGDTVVVSINQVGIRHRFLGGTIKPKKAGGFLTIPVHPSAYGKRAREFNNLEIVFGHNGQPVALATKSTRATQITAGKNGRTIKRSIGRTGEIMFRLVRSVTQQPDPTILPYPEVIGAAVATAVNETVAREIRRGRA